MIPLTNKERMKRLVENYKSTQISVLMDFANQFHQLAIELEKEKLREVKDFGA